MIRQWLKTMARDQRWWALALGVWWIVGMVNAWAGEPTAPLLRDGEHEVTVQEYRQMLLTLPDERARTRYQDNARLGEDVLRYIDQRKRMAAEAERLGLAEQPELQAMFAVARRQILSDALLARYLRDMQYPDFTDLAHEYYLTHREEYRIPEQLDLAQIELKVSCECERGDQRALAEKILARLQAGESFEDLAKQYSNDKTAAASGGLLTLQVGQSGVDSAFQAAALALDAEHPLSSIVETPEGYYLIRLLRRHDASERDFESVKAEIIERLRKNYQATQMADYQARFKTGSTAVINQELLKDQALPQ